MQRRRCLALVAAASIPLAGCSGGGGGGGEDDTGDDPATTGGSSTGGNSTDDTGGSDTGGDQTDTDGNSSDGEPEGPTEQELAQEDIAGAQASLQAAVDELEAQGTSYGTLDGTENGPPVTAGVDSLSAGPVRDALSTAATDVAAAREHETTSEQEATLSTIVATKDWLHAVLNAYGPLHELYLQVHYGVQDLRAEGATPDVQAIRRAADQAQSPVESATSPYAIPDAGATGVGAITNAGVQAQADRLTSDLEAGRSVADSIERILAGEEIFWPAREAYPGGEGEPPEIGVFEDAQVEYQAGVDALAGNAASMGAAVGYCNCYASNMETAAEQYKVANDYYKFGSVGDTTASDHQENAEAAIDSAQSCPLDWSA